MTTPHFPADKTALRALVQERRRSLSAGASDVRASAVAINAAQLLREWGIYDGVVAAFVSFGHEPPTDLLITALEELGYNVILPRVVAPGQLEWLRYEGLLESDLLGIAAPATGEPLSLRDARAVFIPGLAAANDGARLGRGAGYYDRELEDVPRFEAGGPLRIGVIDEAGLLPEGSIPMEPHDQWLDALIVG